MNIQHSVPSHASKREFFKKFACESLILKGVASPPLHAIFPHIVSLLRLLCVVVICWSSTFLLKRND